MFGAILLSILVALAAAGYTWVLLGDDGDTRAVRRYERERDAFERLMK